MTSRSIASYLLHAECEPLGSTRISAPSAFRALSDYRRLRRDRWSVVLITTPAGHVTDEAALRRSVTINGRAEEVPEPEAIRADI